MTPHDTPPTDAQLDAACEWFVRLRGDDPDGERLQGFAAWLAEDAAHQTAFDAAATLFNDPALGQLVPATVTPIEPPRQRQQRRWWPLGVAAAAIIATLTLVWLPEPTHVYSSDIGQQRAVRLDDGSQVTLNTDTQLAVSISDAERHVQLQQGEAWFDVAAAPERPFTVSTRGVRVTAVGTAFSVEQQTADTLVNLAEGNVLVAAGENQVRLVPGQRARVGAGGQIEVQEVGVDHMATWRRQIYEGVSLGELVADLNRYMPANMVIDDPALAATKVSAILHIGDQDTMLEALTRSLDLRWESAGNDRILLLPADTGTS